MCFAEVGGNDGWGEWGVLTFTKHKGGRIQVGRNNP